MPSETQRNFKKINLYTKIKTIWNYSKNVLKLNDQILFFTTYIYILLTLILLKNTETKYVVSVFSDNNINFNNPFLYVFSKCKKIEKRPEMFRKQRKPANIHLRSWNLVHIFNFCLKI